MSTEGARQPARRIPGTPDSPPPASAGGIDDLLDALMAEAEFLCDFPQRRSGKVYPPDDSMVFCPRCFDLTFRLGETGGGSSSLVQ
jgi:hypothetical protein